MSTTLLRLSQIARLLGVSRARAYGLAARGQFGRPIPVHTSTVAHYDLAEIARYAGRHLTPYEVINALGPDRVKQSHKLI